MSLRIIFAGTPEFATPALQALIDRDLKPILVLTQPDRPAGRGRQLQQSPVKQLAIAHGIDCWQPSSLKGTSLAEHHADLLVTAAYGLLLPESLLSEPRWGAWNLHASLLPRWRGASPIQQAILAGDEATGISLMQMDAGLDTGPVFLQESIAIDPQETAGALHDRLAVLAATVLNRGLDALLNGTLPKPSPQPTEGVTHAHLIKKGDALLVWSESADTLERQVRAYNPWPVAFTDVFEPLGEPVCRIWAAKARTSDGTSPPGTVLGATGDGILVACGEGALNITELQAPGRKRLSAREWLNAHPRWR